MNLLEAQQTIEWAGRQFATIAREQGLSPDTVRGIIEEWEQAKVRREKEIFEKALQPRLMPLEAGHINWQPQITSEKATYRVGNLDGFQVPVPEPLRVVKG